MAAQVEGIGAGLVCITATLAEGDAVVSLWAGRSIPDDLTPDPTPGSPSGGTPASLRTACSY